MIITTTIEVRAVVTVVESPGQTGARQSDGAPLEPSFEREARIASVELPDAEGVALPIQSPKEWPTPDSWIWFRESPAHKWRALFVNHQRQIDHAFGPMWMSFAATRFPKLQWAGPLPLPGHATPAHLPVESLSPTDAQRLLRLAEREAQV